MADHLYQLGGLRPYEARVQSGWGEADVWFVLSPNGDIIREDEDGEDFTEESANAYADRANAELES